MAKPLTSKEYFAGSDADQCVSTLMSKSSTFYKFMGGNAYIDKIYRMWRAYHGIFQDNSFTDHQISFTGE